MTTGDDGRDPGAWAYQPREDLEWQPGELSPGPAARGVEGLSFRWIGKGESLFGTGGHRLRLNIPLGEWGTLGYRERALVAEDPDGRLVASALCHVHERGRDDPATAGIAEPRYLALEYARTVEPWRGHGVFARMAAIMADAYPGMPIVGIAIDKTGVVARFLDAHRPTPGRPRGE